MQFRGTVFLSGVLLAAVALAQGPPANIPPPPAGEPTIRTETRLVLVDVVVTDKKGNYVSDLALKDFKVWEDNKEQSLKTFQFGADPSAPANNQKRYMVLFFDNSSMDMGDQVRARQEAGKFIDKNAGPDRLMAIVNFGGSLQISQNFTDDAERLKQVVSGTKTSATSTQPASVGGPGGMGGLGRLGGAGGDFGVRTVLLSLRQLAKNLSDVPGRKTLVMFTSGFPFTPEIQPELTAAIDACNRANVAVYPIDVRGLVSPTQFPFGGPRGRVMGAPSGVRSAALLPVALRGLGIALAGDPVLRVASFMAEYVAEQGRGGGTTGGAPSGGAPAGGAPAGGGGASPGGGGRGGATGGSPGGT